MAIGTNLFKILVYTKQKEINMNTTTKTKLTQRAITQFDAHYDTPTKDHVLISSDSKMVKTINGTTYDLTTDMFKIRLPLETPITVYSDDCDESWIAVVKYNEDYSMPSPITFTFNTESIAEDMDINYDKYVTFCIQLRGDNLFIQPTEESSHVWKRYSIAELLNDEDFVKARFELSDYSEESFEGYHNPTKTWNGWNVPSFTKTMSQEVIAYLNTLCEEDAILADDDISPNGQAPNGEPLFTVASGFCWVTASLNEVAQANLVKTRFAIDVESDNDAFEGYHNPNHRWNGWATPLFTLEVLTEIIKACSTEDYPIVFEADYVPSDETDETTSVILSSKLTSPSGEELYMTDGWCWVELD